MCLKLWACTVQEFQVVQLDNSSSVNARYRFDMSVEEAAELARRAIYHATFRDGASGGVASGTLWSPLVCMSLPKYVRVEFDGLKSSLWASLSRGTQWVEEAVRWWCWWAPLQVQSRNAQHGGAGDGRGCRTLRDYYSCCGHHTLKYIPFATLALELVM